MALEDRIVRVESKVDQLQSQAHSNHLEILSAFNDAKEEATKELNDLKMKVERHEGYFSGIVRLLGLGSLISGWLAIKDLFPHSK